VVVSVLVGNQTSAVGNQTSKVENYLVPNPKLFPTSTFKSVLVGNLFESNFYSKYGVHLWIMLAVTLVNFFSQYVTVLGFLWQAATTAVTVVTVAAVIAVVGLSLTLTV
jgi:hypothetical protein